MKIQIKLSKCIFQPKKGIWSSQVVKRKKCKQFENLGKLCKTVQLLYMKVIKRYF